jgi:putative transposase
MEKLCGLFGKSRRAIYDYLDRQKGGSLKEEIILQYVMQVRSTLPRLGTRKLHYKLVPLLKEHGIEMGRDRLFNLLSEHRLLIRQRKRKVITTNSRHWMRKYQNRVREVEVVRAEQVWVSDITFIRLVNQWGYLSLITDAYSRKIMGYGFRLDMSTVGCLDALKMALDNRTYPERALIHHSDRGSQYCSAAYTSLLTENGIAISMTENGDPYENALAERVNGILKGEFNLYESRLSFPDTYERVKESIKAYNEKRPHLSLGMLTPDEAHRTKTSFERKWKNYPFKSKEQQDSEASPAYL